MSASGSSVSEEIICLGASGSASVAASLMISMPNPGSIVSILSQSSQDDHEALAAGLDIDIGRRIKLRRIQLGLSQSDLARKIGPVAFHQVQKYENGTDRVSASRLYLIAEALSVGIGFFYGRRRRRCRHRHRGRRVRHRDYSMIRSARNQQ